MSKNHTITVPLTGSLDGATVTCRVPQSVREMDRLENAANRVEDAVEKGEGMEALFIAMLNACDLIGRLLVSWNLTDARGKPLSPDARGLKGLTLEPYAQVATDIGTAFTQLGQEG